MSELERAIGFTEVNVPPPRRPRYLLSRRAAITLVVLGYIGTVAFVAALLAALESFQAYNDFRNYQATTFFAVVLAAPFGWALVTIWRRSKLPAWPF